ncbi:MFS transporter [Sulfolobus sp. S-194]|uniref:MFS transporter n=1 Tax=Sulfolobus sp. S-194 TaxID=2512240 RepID=UPI0014372CB1|nr:MFS transporter [Sulfolobus sp. S-194]QIW25143.1 MFS transporter [Sulfolobus sp. S-194]
MSNNPFKSIDSLKLSFNHIKIWYTAGMGFFTDAYDLLIIGYIIATLEGAYKYAGIVIPGFTEYLVGHNADFWTGLLASSAIWTAIIGQLLFGYLGDRLGRKSVYGIEASMLTLGAFLSALAWNLPALIAFRMLMGFGIGGDYPISSTIMSEYANVKDRGKLVALVFANQGIGSIVAAVVGIVSALTLPPDIAWRVMAGIGAIPAATVIYLRRKVPETPRYSLLAKGNIEEAKKAAELLGTKLNVDKRVISKKLSISEFFAKYGLLLIGTAGTWFILDIAFYGTGTYSSAVLAPIFGSPFPNGHVTLSLADFQADLAKDLFLGAIPFLVGFPGYFTAVALMDKLGRKVIQLQGFIMMAVIYGIVASIALTSGTKITGFVIPPTLAFAIYSLSYFFIDFGPNTTTFVIPSEVYPVRYRTTGHGISAASGKLGAAITTYLFPVLLASIGIKNILIMLAIVSIIGAVLTYLFVPEPKHKPLEEVAKEELEEEQNVQS